MRIVYSDAIIFANTVKVKRNIRLNVNFSIYKSRFWLYNRMYKEQTQLKGCKSQCCGQARDEDNAYADK